MEVHVVGRRHSRLLPELLLEISTVAEATVLCDALVAPVWMGLDDPLRLLILRDSDLRGHAGHIHTALQIAATLNPPFHGMYYPQVGF